MNTEPCYTCLPELQCTRHQYKEPLFRCQRCRKVGTKERLNKYFCSDIPLTCFQIREYLRCSNCETDFDDINEWSSEPEYDGEPGPGSGLCVECKEGGAA